MSESDGTLILTPGRKLAGGSLLTNNYCIKLGRPYLHICPGDDWHDQIAGFIKNHWIEVLNLAGPSNAQDLEPFVCNVLDEVLRAWNGSY